MDKVNGFIYRNDGDMRSHEFFLYSFVRGLKPKRVLEIGVRSGVSTLAMTTAIADGGFDCDYHICDIDPACLQLKLPILTIPHITSSDNLAEEWKLGKSLIDLLLIDGCHEYSQVYKDFIHFLPFINTGGFVLFHDTNPSEQDKNPNMCWDAYKILEDLKKLAKEGIIEYVTLPYSYGLTIVGVIGKLHTVKLEL
jgi:predicted O-methyltransferase YrrM